MDLHEAISSDPWCVEPCEIWALGEGGRMSEYIEIRSVYRVNGTETRMSGQVGMVRVVQNVSGSRQKQ